MKTIELPPLVPDSPTAKLLYEVWSGNRLVRHWPLNHHHNDSVSVLVDVIAHLHMRAGFSVLLVSGPELQRLYRPALERYIPDAMVSSYGSPTEFHPLVRLDHGGEDSPIPAAELFDLVVLSGGAPSSRSDLFRYLAAGRQFLSFGVPIGRLELGDRTDLVVPIDVALAGGVEG